jgi:hypothetical protein
MNKNIVHTLASEGKRSKPSHKISSTKEHLFKCAVKE